MYFNTSLCDTTVIHRTLSCPWLITGRYRALPKAWTQSREYRYTDDYAVIQLLDSSCLGTQCSSAAALCTLPNSHHGISCAPAG